MEALSGEKMPMTRTKGKMKEERSGMNKVHLVK
jgi:hypothetical protein